MEIFISYNSKDRDHATKLVRALASNHNVFIDVDSIRYGAFWQPVLSKAIEKSKVLILLISEAIGPWQRIEYYEALSKRVRNKCYKLIPIILQEKNDGIVPNLPFLSQFNLLRCAPLKLAHYLDDIVSAIHGKPVSSALERWRVFNPYRGLVALTEDYSDFLFGRESEIETSTRHLLDPQCKLLTLIGNSGVGKSSLVQAGIIGGLRRNFAGFDSQWTLAHNEMTNRWSINNFRPGGHPFRHLAAAFVSNWFPDPSDPQRYDRMDAWAARLRNGGNIGELISSADEIYSNNGSEPPTKYLIYMDQGEELFLIPDKEEKDKLIEIFEEALAEPRVRLMTTIRADLYGELQRNRDFFDNLRRIDVPALSYEGLHATMFEPARRFGVDVEGRRYLEEFAEKAASEKGALPLIADYMAELWADMQERGDGVLKIIRQDNLNDPGRRLAERGDRFLANHPKFEKVVPMLFSFHLASISPTTSLQRRRVYAADCSKLEWDCLLALAKAEWRLVVVSSDGCEASAELAHEILLSYWGKIPKWIDDYAGAVRARGAINKQFARWRNRSLLGSRKELLDPGEYKVYSSDLLHYESLLPREVLSFMDLNKTIRSVKRSFSRACVIGAVLLLFCLAVESFNFHRIEYQKEKLLTTLRASLQKPSSHSGVPHGDIAHPSEIDKFGTKADEFVSELEKIPSHPEIGEVYNAQSLRNGFETHKEWVSAVITRERLSNIKSLLDDANRIADMSEVLETVFALMQEFHGEDFNSNTARERALAVVEAYLAVGERVFGRYYAENREYFANLELEKLVKDLLAKGTGARSRLSPEQMRVIKEIDELEHEWLFLEQRWIIGPVYLLGIGLILAQVVFFGTWPLIYPAVARKVHRGAVGGLIR